MSRKNLDYPWVEDHYLNFKNEQTGPTVRYNPDEIVVDFAHGCDPEGWNHIRWRWVKAEDVERDIRESARELVS